MAQRPSFHEVNRILKKNPEKVWVDQDERQYGWLSSGEDSIHTRDESWWIRLPRWTIDPNFNASASRGDETMVYPRVGDELVLRNVQTGKKRTAHVLRYPIRTKRGQRMVEIILTF